MRFSVASILSIFAIVVSCSNAFAPGSHSTNNRTAFVDPKSKIGATKTDDDASSPVTPQATQEQREQFENLFNEVLNCSVREHLPGIVTKNVGLLLELNGGAGLELFNEQLAKAQASEDQELIDRAHATVEYIVFFIETFVSQAKMMDDNNKTLLGKIFKCMKDAEDDPSLERQEKLDALIKAESDNFTPGFLRHLDAVCTRIGNAKKMTPETAKMLEVMRVIQTRIVEEVGQHLGEGAQVLGQLLGYECSTERLAVLDAGLKVRGVEFATELKGMTEEALDGFKKVAGVEPGLIEIVEEVDERIGQFISENE